jgi:RNA polymerase sigma-70 factor (ECF subfamily)
MGMTAKTAAEQSPSVEADVRSAASGDEAAFALIVESHNADLLRVCYTICCDVDLAEEAVQAAWIIAWQRLGSLREVGRLRAWLLTVAVNEARRVLRERRRRTVVELSVAVTSDEHGLVDDLGSRAADVDLANALARLHPDDRALLALRYVAGLTSAELGPALGMSASGTRARLARLLDRLRKDLHDG